MKAVILVGGEGTRLRPLTYDLPKPMVPIVNKPYMEHQVEYLLRHGFRDIVFALGYKSEAFQSYFADGSRWGARFWYVVESVPLGTSGAVKNVESLLDDTFLVFNGDVLSDIDLTGLIRLHRDRGAVGTLALTPVDDPSAYGVVETDADGRIQAFVEKPPPGTAKSNAINAGVYILEPSVLRYILPAGQKCMFETYTFPNLLAAGEPLFASVSNAYWLDIGSPARYLQANHDVLGKAVRVEMPAVDGRHQWISEQARIQAGATLRGPLWIGAGAEVAAAATVIGPTVLSANCVVREGAEIEGAVVWQGSVIERGARLHNCMVGRDCVVGENAVMESEAVLGSGHSLAAGEHLQPGQKVPL